MKSSKFTKSIIFARYSIIFLTLIHSLGFTPELIYINIYIYSSKPHPERRAMAEHFCCGFEEIFKKLAGMYLFLDNFICISRPHFLF